MKLHKKTFKFHSDAAHGWLAVKKSDLDLLGIRDQISPYSYMKGQTAYLEEDRDMAVFIKAFREVFKNESYVDPIIEELDPKDRSHIRSMDQYNNIPF